MRIKEIETRVEEMRKESRECVYDTEMNEHALHQEMNEMIKNDSHGPYQQKEETIVKSPQAVERKRRREVKARRNQHRRACKHRSN